MATAEYRELVLSNWFSDTKTKYNDISRNMVDKANLCVYNGIMNIDQAANCMDALGITVRLSIYKMLVEAGNKGLSVGQIQEKTDTPRSTVSHHIHRLMQADLVTQERTGTTLICRANYEVMNDLLAFLERDCCVADQNRKLAKAKA